MDRETIAKIKVVMPEDNKTVDPMTASFRENVAICLEESKRRNIPIVLFDPHTRKTYLKYADGTREYF